LRLTFATEYGCLALLAIGEASPDFCKRQQIIQRFDIPAAFLEQVLRKLTAAGILVPRRGPQGGFSLARPAAAIAIADVARAIDGPLAPTRSVSENYYFPTPVEGSIAFHQLFRRVRDAIAEILESTSLEDMLEQEKRSRTAAHRRGNQGRRSAGAATRRL
jgi:Rrf2 family protein